MPKRIAVIGTRDVDSVTVDTITKQVKETYGEDVIIYSGHAYGVDQVASNFKHNHIFIPWNTYNKELRKPGTTYHVCGSDERYDTFIYNTFPHSVNFTDGVWKLVRRNAFIILGDITLDIPPVDLVLWYTGKGIAGGTAYGIKIAQVHNILTEEIIIDAKTSSKIK